MHFSGKWLAGPKAASVGVGEQADGGVASALYKNGAYKFKKQQERNHHTIKTEP